MTDNYYALIMAGGGGTRLWPLSRRSRPKQMLKLFGDSSLFQIAISRLEGIFPPDKIFVVTAQEQASDLMEQAPHIPPENYLLEPEPRGTASAIGLGAAIINEKNPDAVIAVLTADHFIGEEEMFRNILSSAEEVAREGYLVTLGIEPTFASTGYGYIQRGEVFGKYQGFDAYHVMRFKEKPVEAEAEKLFASDDHDWNSGMFIWKTQRVLREFSKQMPELYSAITQISSSWGGDDRDQVLKQAWLPLRSETIDFGIMENAEDVIVIPASGLKWNDVGSWDALFDVLNQDEDGNIKLLDQSINISSKNTLLYSENPNRLIAAIGLEDVAIIDTEDVLLVCSKESAEKVRQAIKLLKDTDQEEYL